MEHSLGKTPGASVKYGTGHDVRPFAIDVSVVREVVEVISCKSWANTFDEFLGRIGIPPCDSQRRKACFGGDRYLCPDSLERTRGRLTTCELQQEDKKRDGVHRFSLGR